MMQYADFMAFPFPQHQLMTKREPLTVASGIILDTCHTTSVSPYVRKMEEIVREHEWFIF